MEKKLNFLSLFSNIYLKKKTPISLVHFLTNRCNARCSFCFIDFDNPETFKSELSTEEIYKLTLSLPDTLLNVNFTGGEPFARKDINTIAKYYLLNTSIKSIYVTTNASLPERIFDFASTISQFEKKIDLNIQISIDHFPDRHNQIRKIRNLFDLCIETFRVLKNMNNPKVKPVINITVSNENCDDIEEIFNYLTDFCKIDSIKCCIVRDEGVYKTPTEEKKKILNAYSWLTENIKKKRKEKKIQNYSNSIQSKIHNKKDEISWDLIKKIYETNQFISPCHASSLFGVISANGNVYPCEILEDKLIGNLRNFDMSFIKLWRSDKNKQIKDFILNNNCKCTYECAMSFNILGNYRYHHKLLSSLFF